LELAPSGLVVLSSDPHMLSYDSTSWVLYFVWAVGVVTVARFVFHILRELWKRLLRPAADLTKYRKDGAWAGNKSQTAIR